MAEVNDVDSEVDETEETSRTRSEKADAMWSEARVDPVEIALPQGLGYTLRAYRMSDAVVLSDVDRDEDDFTALERKEDPLSEDDEDDSDDEASERHSADDRDLDESDDEADEGAPKRRDADDDSADDDSAEEDSDDEDKDSEDESAEAEESEEIPVFLGYAGKLYLFATPEALVDFVCSDTNHDLTQVDGWATLREQITADDVIADDADRYELDLVVENLRGGQDVWDTDLLVQAGEIARDLGYALRVEPIMTALASGSPLDDLDEALRATNAGMISGYFARRRLRKIGTQQATLGWRTIIGKISAVVDWRE